MNDSVSARLEAEFGIPAVPGRKGPCPFCGHPTFSIRSDDTLGKCFHPSCGRFITASEAPHRVPTARTHLAHTERDTGLTLAQYLSAKQLPKDLLEGFGVSDTIYRGARAICIPYYDESMENEIAVRYRVSIDGDDRFRWERGTTPVLYGLWLLETARQEGCVVICEGESDVHTLWSHDIPAVGLPGANTWKGSWSEHFERIPRIYVVIEPDAGGKVVREALESSRLRDRCRFVRLAGHKDPSELHCTDPESFMAGWKSAVNNAEAAGDTSQGGAVETAEGAGGKEGSAAVRLIHLVEADGIELFHDDLGESFARVSAGSHREIWSCRSRNFKGWLAKRFWESEARALGSDAIAGALNVLDAKARFEGPEHQLHNRVASHDGAIWYDLADREWRAVRITERGWEIIAEPPILFRRYSHQQAQQEPARGGDLRDLLEFVNLHGREQSLLLLAYLVCCFVPDIPHPIPVLHGPAGAAKTTLFTMVRRLVDPSATPVLSFPRRADEFVQQLSHHWCPFYDNLTGIPDWTSDMLCRAVTGEGMSKRQLYSDDEDVIYRFRRCVGLNGINVAARKADLLDRCILFGLDKIDTSERKAERVIWERFERVQPALLGAAFDTLSRAMALRESVDLTQLPRMADFAVWGCAVARALEHTDEEFLNAYEGNARARNEEALEASPVAVTVIALMDGCDEWSGTMSGLLAELEERAQGCRVSTKARLWPKAAHVLSRRLNEVLPNLAEVGIEVVHRPEGRQRMVTIRKVPGRSVSSVSSVAESEDGVQTILARDAIGDSTAEI